MGKPHGAKPAGKAHKQQPKQQQPKQQQHKQQVKQQVKAQADDAQAASALQQLGTKLSEGSVAWYAAVSELAQPTAEEPKKKKKGGKQAAEEPKALLPTDALVLEKKKLAEKLLEQEVARFEAKKSGKMSSDDKYLATMIKSGTLSDRVASLTLTVQASPFHSLVRLGQLIAMANKKARRESIMAVESLKDLFINNLLPDDRKLRFFHQNPLEHPKATPAHLVLWFFEHCLKTAFAQLVGVLSSGMEDAVDNHKRACIRAANSLLTAKPEQEAVLLAMLVNKLGDPDRKIAAYIHRMLQDLLRQHPVMKRVVVDEVERLLTRPKVSDRAKYNAVLFLNQIYLDASGDDAELAAHLITVYFGLFSMEVHGSEAAEAQQSKKKDKKKKSKSAADAALQTAMDRKLLSALLLGVNRAFPYANATSADFQQEIDTLFKVAHKAHHTTSVQALMLLFQVMNSTNSVSDRFYVALYDKLLDPRLRETSKHTAFLNLVFRAMKADVSPARISAMVKRLLQVATVMTPAFICAVLFLLSELLKLKPQLRTLIDQPEASAGNTQDEERFNDAEAALHLDKEEEEEDEDDDEGEDEAAVDRDDGRTDAEQSSSILAQMFGDLPSEPTSAPSSGGVVSFDDDDDMPSKKADAKKKTGASDNGYDPRKRNPLYAKADASCAWELDQLARHYHPSVQMFARQVIENRPGGIQYAGDPLVDFTMLAFFEKFVNKKPRHRDTSSSASHGAAPKSWTFAPINTEAVLQQNEESLDASDKFFYKFFQERAKREAAMPSRRRKKRNADDDDRDGDAFSDIDEDGDEEEDEEMEAYAQQLAEGIMQDGNMDDEDPDMEGWDNDSDGDDADGAQIDGEDDDDDEAELDTVNANEGSDDDEDGGDDDEDEDEDEEDDEDGFDFATMADDADDNDEVLQKELSKLAAKQTPPSSSGKKRKSTLFASADDYDQLVRDALAKQKQAGSKSKKRRSA